MTFSAMVNLGGVSHPAQMIDMSHLSSDKGAANGSMTAPIQPKKKEATVSKLTLQFETVASVPR